MSRAPQYNRVYCFSKDGDDHGSQGSKGDCLCAARDQAASGGCYRMRWPYCIDIDQLALSSDHRDHSIPYPLAVPALQTKDTMATAQFDEIMQRGLIQVAFRCGRCFPRCWLFLLAFRCYPLLEINRKICIIRIESNQDRLQGSIWSPFAFGLQWRHIASKRPIFLGLMPVVTPGETVL